MIFTPDDFYTELLLDHARRPRHCQQPTTCDGCAEGFNPLCGDRVSVWLSIGDDAVTDISFKGQGCAISTASASMMTESLRGLPLDEARRLLKHFLSEAVGADSDNADDEPLDDSLLCLTNIRRLPARVKCVTLAWHAALEALRQATTKDDTNTADTTGADHD